MSQTNIQKYVPVDTRRHFNVVSTLKRRLVSAGVYHHAYCVFFSILTSLLAMGLTLKIYIFIFFIVFNFVLYLCNWVRLVNWLFYHCSLCDCEVSLVNVKYVLNEVNKNGRSANLLWKFFFFCCCCYCCYYCFRPMVFFRKNSPNSNGFRERVINLNL